MKELHYICALCEQYIGSKGERRQIAVNTINLDHSPYKEISIISIYEKKGDEIELYRQFICLDDGTIIELDENIRNELNEKMISKEVQMNANRLYIDHSLGASRNISAFTSNNLNSFNIYNSNNLVNRRASSVFNSHNIINRNTLSVALSTNMNFKNTSSIIRKSNTIRNKSTTANTVSRMRSSTYNIVNTTISRGPSAIGGSINKV